MCRPSGVLSLWTGSGQLGHYPYPFPSEGRDLIAIGYALWDHTGKQLWSNDRVLHDHSDAVMMGTGPGELWVGQDEIRNAYTHFFEDFDPGKQSFESLWHHGNVGPQGAWLMNVSKVSMTRGSSTTEFGLNSSLVAVKADGKWLIQAMHFSNLTPATQS